MVLCGYYMCMLYTIAQPMDYVTAPLSGLPFA